jgi:hypothetical protein
MKLFPKIWDYLEEEVPAEEFRKRCKCLNWVMIPLFVLCLSFCIGELVGFIKV